MVPEEGPVDNVEQDEAGGEEPARDAVDEHRLLALLLHHVADLLLPLQLDVVHQALDALLAYHMAAAPAGAADGGGRSQAADAG